MLVFGYISSDGGKLYELTHTRDIPEAFYRIHTLEGGLGVLPQWELNGQSPLEHLIGLK